MDVIGEKIKQLRDERNWNQKELAYKLHVTQSTVSSWDTYTPEVKNCVAGISAAGWPEYGEMF